MESVDKEWRDMGVDLDMSCARPALAWNYLLGEKDHYAADREVADKMLAVLPDLAMMARADRRFVFLVVWQMMIEMGIRQFIDLGSGVPYKRNMNIHEIAQDIDPTARILYIDNDPIVATHSRALLAGSRTGRVEFLEADATDPGSILNHPVTTTTLDLSQPVALMAVSVLMHFPDAVAHHIMSTLLAGLPAGSCVVISHMTADFNPAGVAEAVSIARQGGITYIPRTHAQVKRFFNGLDLIEPGITPSLAWKPGTTTEPGDDLLTMNSINAHCWVGIGRRRPIAPPPATIEKEAP